MGVCPYCDKEFETKSLGGHVARCKMNPNYEKTHKKDKENLKKATIASVEVKKLPRLEFKQICPKCGKEFVVIGTQNEFDRGRLKKYCSRACANSRVFNEEAKEKKSKALKEYYVEHDFPIGFGRYTNREGITSIYKTYICKYCGKEFTIKDTRDTNGRQYCSSECRKNWIKENVKWGGYRKGSGNGKQGWYKGIHCDSTWELAFLIYHLDNRLNIKRFEGYREYEYNGEKHKYYPDFITDEGIIEIKGYKTEQWISKQQQNPDIKVLYKDDIQKYINYVHDKYTNKLEELYDGSKPNYDEHRKFYWMHNNTEETMVISDKIEEYLSKGWIKGRIKNKKHLKI